MKLTLTLAQLNPTLGDIEGNLAKARKARSESKADVIAFTELFLTGYPPEDLVLKPAFQAAAKAALFDLAKDTITGPAVLIGLPYREGDALYNTYAYLADGEVKALRHKVDLPNYGVFDEKRVFTQGPNPGPVNIKGFRIGLPVCEDIWGDEVVETLAETGAEFLLSPNGSPYWRGKNEERLNIAVARVREQNLPLVYLNQVGGQDELVFDGASFALNADLSLAVQMPQFEEACVTITLEKTGEGVRITPISTHDIYDGDKADYAACVLGLKDYVTKNGFKGVVLGLSGGIDSAICLALAVDALGADKVHAVMMPYKYTAEDSLEDASECAKLLGVRYDIIEIKDPVEGFTKALTPLFAGTSQDTTEENLQSRARGTLLMALSNKFGTMLVTTGNKSEMSVGYCTIYGDMNGGFNPIKDLYKTEVFRLSHLRNTWKPSFAKGAGGVVIPERIITKPPSAELRENQKDQDSLPPYDDLDTILKGLIENESHLSDIIALGFDETVVKRIERLLYLAEYKRRQSAPGVKVTRKNFGRDRRYPITNKFRDGGHKLGDFAKSESGNKARSEYLDF
jgi:NAD+ synthase